MEGFISVFSDVEDPRADNARHNLLEVLFIALAAVLCGAESCSDMADFGEAKETLLRQVLRLENGVPSHENDVRSKLPMLTYLVKRSSTGTVWISSWMPTSLSIDCASWASWRLTATPPGMTKRSFSVLPPFARNAPLCFQPAASSIDLAFTGSNLPYSPELSW